MERQVPARLVSFAGRLVRLLDTDDPDVFVDADDAVQTSYASGGRTGDDEFFITYYPSRRETWSFVLDERTLRRLAANALSTIDVDVLEKPAPESRARRGDAFALWGENERARAMVTSEADIDGLLAWLRGRTRHDSGVATAILGGTFGDLAFIAIAPDETAHLSVVFRSGERSALIGDDAQVEPLPASFPLLPDPVPLAYRDYVSLSSVRDALVRLVLAGTVDRELRWTPAMHGGLLLDLPSILTERGFTVPLARPFRAFTESEIAFAVADMLDENGLDSTAVANALVGALVDQSAIELTGDRGRDVLCERIALRLDERREGEPLGLMDLLMSDSNVVDVFVDDAALDALFARVSAGSDPTGA